MQRASAAPLRGKLKAIIMQLTKNFSKSEFESHDGALMPAEALANIKEVAKNLQVLRDFYGLPIIVNSGYRSTRHNTKVGGAPNSQHKLGKAADIVVSGKTPKQVKSDIEKLITSGKMAQGGIGLYNSFVHYDIRGYAARW